MVERYYSTLRFQNGSYFKYAEGKKDYWVVEKQLPTGESPRPRDTETLAELSALSADHQKVLFSCQQISRLVINNTRNSDGVLLPREEDLKRIIELGRKYEAPEAAVKLFEYYYFAMIAEWYYGSNKYGRLPTSKAVHAVKMLAIYEVLMRNVTPAAAFADTTRLSAAEILNRCNAYHLEFPPRPSELMKWDRTIFPVRPVVGKVLQGWDGLS